MLSPFLVRSLCALLLANTLFAQADSIEVGSQSPNAFIHSRFFTAYSRSGFAALVSLPPVTHVQKFGANGYIQLFADAAQTPGVRLALVKADANQSLSYDPNTGEINGGDAYQITAPLFGYVASVNGASATAPGNFNVTGFPRADTRSADCGTAVCLYQFFDKDYALFSYLPSPLGEAGVNYMVKGTFYTTWMLGGQVSGLGAPATNEAEITSLLTSVKADWQQFRTGYLFRFESGTAAEKFIPVTSPVAEFFKENGGPTGGLGLPVEIVRSLPDGRFRQSFEGGTIEYRPGERPVLLLPVRQVLIEGAPVTGMIKLRRGESIDVRARLLDAFAEELIGRTVNWITSNGRIVSIDASGAQAKLRAVGAGLATVTALSEGRRSAPLSISVSSQCCEAGEGAPNAIVSQAIQETIRRNRINVSVPTGAPVQRLGAGYFQEFKDAVTAAPYLIAVPDPGSTGFLVKGEILGRLNAFGGLAGWLGYPGMEETTGGRQVFSGRYALAGRPVRVVQTPLLERWAFSGYEAGPLGGPTSEATQLLTFSGAAGIVQPFSGGVLAASSSDQRAFALTAPFLAKYLELDGASGELGLPTSEEVIVDGLRRQGFEGGTLLQPPGGELAVNLEPRKPRILITPNPVTAGSRVRIAAGGFPSGHGPADHGGVEPRLRGGGGKRRLRLGIAGGFDGSGRHGASCCRRCRRIARGRNVSYSVCCGGGAQIDESCR